MRYVPISVGPTPGRDAALLNSRFLVTSCVVALFFGLLLGASAVAGPDLRSFAGTWQGQFDGKTFVTLKLIEHEGKLTGTCVHTTSLEKNARGELTNVAETQTEDSIVEAHLKGSELQISIADNGNAREPMQCALRLTGKNEGELQIVSDDAVAWKPWKVKRTGVK